MNDDEKEKIKEEDIPVEAFKDLDCGYNDSFTLLDLLLIVFLVVLAAKM